MKKLLLILATCALFVSCTKEEPATADRQPDRMAAEPSIYGMAMLKDAPATRGVAIKTKVWNKVMAKEDLTVKFLNGTAEYKSFIKSVAAEWEKVADVKFHFLDDASQEAMIRIGFDYVPGMQSSWSYTGTDHMYLLDQQTEPTMHFARWRRISDACKRSDVLRAFGQVLGLELEFRHPDFYPTWKTTPEGTVDEEYIRGYWEDELAGFITWDELKTMVLDPINVNARYIAKTDNYDPSSVMSWPFYERLAGNLDPISYDSDYNTKLSPADITFIQSLYGAFGTKPQEEYFFPLIEFYYTGTAPAFRVTMMKNLGVKWDASSDEIQRINFPLDAFIPTTLISHNYPSYGKRKIIIGEMTTDKNQVSSTALEYFQLQNGVGADSIVIHSYNEALETVWIKGGQNFIAQDFNFKGNIHLKNLYLINTGGSTVNVENCEQLEILSNTPSIYRPTLVGDIQTADNDPTFDRPIELKVWPNYPMEYPSISSVNIKGCTNLKTLSLDYTNIDNISFMDNNHLEEVYISAMGYNSIFSLGSPRGIRLLFAVNTLPSRMNDTKGVIIFRGIGLYLVPAETEQPDGQLPVKPLTNEARYENIKIDSDIFEQITSECKDKNWQIVWGPGYTLEK